MHFCKAEEDPYSSNKLSNVNFGGDYHARKTKIKLSE